jgi:hypothetical protein
MRVTRGREWLFTDHDRHERHGVRRGFGKLAGFVFEARGEAMSVDAITDRERRYIERRRYGERTVGGTADRYGERLLGQRAIELADRETRSVCTRDRIDDMRSIRQIDVVRHIDMLRRIYVRHERIARRLGIG